MTTFAKLKPYLIGFMICYALGAIAYGKNASRIPVTSTAGVVYLGAMWLPIAIVPQQVAPMLMPSWVYDFSKLRSLQHH